LRPEEDPEIIEEEANNDDGSSLFSVESAIEKLNSIIRISSNQRTTHLKQNLNLYGISEYCYFWRRLKKIIGPVSDPPKKLQSIFLAGARAGQKAFEIGVMNTSELIKYWCSDKANNRKRSH
jgi:hypothetical protein